MPALKRDFDASSPQPAAQLDRSKLNLLLLSNGALAQKRNETIQELFGASPENPKTIMYVAYALGDQDAALARTKTWLEPLGFTVISAHQQAEPVAALDKVDGVFVTGGNTFRLLDKLQKSGLLEAIRDKAMEGFPY
ncbi:MAG TPA: Type 1 glutamine amidotransferase-like domain-containing protein, partial [Patescibacteria group bacterium]|nr:Type 1 glutamine amidotransferase-like domain-containing protein [Patescibacteria group bacterium]